MGIIQEGRISKEEDPEETEGKCPWREEDKGGRKLGQFTARDSGSFIWASALTHILAWLLPALEFATFKGAKSST